MEEGLKEQTEARRSMYSFLARTFREEADVPFIEELKAACSPDDELLGGLAASLAGSDTESKRVELASDYARCFLGMHSDPVSPFESVWVSDAHLMMQEPRDEVLEMYRSEGVDVADSFKLPEDHIAIEFEFMALLCRRVLDALEENDPVALELAIEKQKAFLRDHLAPWVPDFCEKLRLRSTTAFYKELAHLAQSLIESDLRDLA